MRHLKRGRKLNRTSSHRKAMLKNLVTSLFEIGKVVTTPAKAKQARPFAERLITMAKKGTLADRRRAIAALNDKQVVAQLFAEIAPRYANRPGGYCRILHLDRYRLGDGGDLCLFELVEENVKKKDGKKKRIKAKVESAVTIADVAEENQPADTANSEKNEAEAEPKKMEAEAEVASEADKPVAEEQSAKTEDK